MRATQRRKIKRTCSWIFLLGGILLVLWGARDLTESIVFQKELANRVTSIPAPAPDLGNALAKMSIPRLGAELFILEGTEKEALRRGPGHMKGSALPGMRGNCIIAGHRDTHFRVLKDIRAGDEILLQTRYGKFRYWVNQTRVISPRNRQPLLDTEAPVLNLITCYPFYYLGPAPKRFVVHASLRRNTVPFSLTRTSITTH